MRFFFPDSQDQVDPNFDFVAEQSPEFRVRQRDDRYAHEVLSRRPYDGLLVSKPIVDGVAGAAGKYTLAQRHRLYRLGVKGFFRLDRANSPISAMGDCGAFSYVREETPPYSVDDVLDFYDGCGFDYGVSVDHVILGYDPAGTGPQVPAWLQRQQLTLDLAADFRRAISRRRSGVTPIGVAQGWNPQSYAAAVSALQRMGYTYIALGGMVSLKTPQIEECLRAVAAVRAPKSVFHLLGVTRVTHLAEFATYGVVSFDSTSPFRQAFKDDLDNYYTSDRNYVAIRVPQIDGNLRVKGLIRAGRLDHDRARKAESLCLQRLVQFDRHECPQSTVLEALRAYACLVDPEKDRTAQYAEFLDRAPWKDCDCGICKAVGVQVAIFRGTERNKRRGFHNLHVFGQRMAAAASSTARKLESTPVPA
jgi:hypothetical protein